MPRAMCEIESVLCAKLKAEYLEIVEAATTLSGKWQSRSMLCVAQMYS